MKYLVSGWDEHYGAWGGIRSLVVKAKDEDTARRKAKRKYGERFGVHPGQSSPYPYGLHVQETELEKPPELPGHWQ